MSLTAVYDVQSLTCVSLYIDSIGATQTDKNILYITIYILNVIKKYILF